MDKTQIMTRLEECHLRELDYNIEMGENNKKIATLRLRNKKIARLISKNMKYRNQLISKL